MRVFMPRQALPRRTPLNSPSIPEPRLQASRAGAAAKVPPAVSGSLSPSPGEPRFRPRFGEELARARLPSDSGLILRKERDEAPPVNPGDVAKSWLYADDPTGHVASIYFETFSSELDEDDNGVLYGVNLLLEEPGQPDRISFIGHSDSTGDAASNRDLSRERAERVKAWFPLPTPKTAVEVTGLGEQGPESTPDNAAELSHFRRVDIVITPPRETTLGKEWPWSHSGGSETLKKEMSRATGALDAAIGALFHAVSGGVPTPETAAALERYFPHPRYRSPEFMQTLLAEIGHIRAHIDSIIYREVRRGDISLHCSTEPYRNVENDWNQDLCAAIRAAARTGPNDVHAVAFSYGPSTVVLMPSWYGKGDPASILVHEAAHRLLGHRGHPNEVPHRDPYAIQGFVAELGGLQAPRSRQRYP